MNRLFRMHGRVVEVLRFEASYTAERRRALDEDELKLFTFPETEKETVTERFPTREEAEQRGGAVTELDASAAEWMDGLEVADVPDTYAEAVRIFEMGREAYEAELAADPEADRDELLLDLAVRLTLLEMGVNG